MKKISLSLLAVTLIALAYSGNPVAQAQADEAHVADAEIKALVKRVYPAFVLIGGGSGVCISEDGYFLTNHHVWTDAVRPSERSVKMAGSGKRFTADAVGADPRGDIVLGKIRVAEGEKLPFARLADSDLVKVGDICLCIGNPFMLAGTGDEPTVTLGTVTATHRFQGGYSDALQIDTAINPGNSGGPSFNLKGEVIGINGRNIANHRKRFNTGAGFAIPSKQVQNYIDEFKAQRGGAHLVRQGFVGGLDFDLGYSGGARIKEVAANSEASDAGFQAGDVITEIDGYDVPTAYRYYGVMGTKPRLSSFTFKVLRGEAVVELTARNDVPVDANQFSNLPQEDRGQTSRGRGRGRRGGGGFNPFALPSPSASLGRGLEYDFNTDRKVGGFVLTTVPNETALSAAGFQAGDILLELNGRALLHHCDYNDVMLALKPGVEVELKFIRDGRERTGNATTDRP